MAHVTTLRSIRVHSSSADVAEEIGMARPYLVPVGDAEKSMRSVCFAPDFRGFPLEGPALNPNLKPYTLHPTP